MNDAVWRGLAAAGVAAGDAAATAARDRLAAELVADFPEITVSTDAAAVRLQAPGLVARAFGSRSRAGDPRLLHLGDVLKGGSR